MADRYTQWSFHRKGRKVERNAYLDGSKKFTVFWAFNQKQTSGRIYMKTHPSALCLQCDRTIVFIVEYTGKLIVEDIQLVIDSYLLYFYLQKGQSQKRTDKANITHLLISISSKFYY